MANPAIDPSVGGLVWVRRRNGSWWPGRIMGLHELSESCLVSPRSGTPVKLLGREDASIDWYNLEKSKRVKAFRCGEYDECIKKAKAASANSCKKTVKYARREDAILHALKLENARMGKGCLDLSCRGDTSSSDHGILTLKSSPMSDSSEEEKDLVNHLDNSSESARELSRSGLSFEEPNHASFLSEQGRRRQTPNDSEDDGMERVKRMKGLEDLGMNVLSKGEDKEELVPLEHLSNFNAGKCISNEYPLDGCKVYSSSSRRKRSLVLNVNELSKRKNRRRPLTKLLESTAMMVSVPVVCDEILMPSNSPPRGLSDGRVPGVEFSESKMIFSAVNNDKSDSVGVACEAVGASPFNTKVKDADFPSMFGLAENNSCDKLFDVPFVGDGKYSTGNQSSQSNQVETLCLGKEVPTESGSISSAAAQGDHSLCQANERGTSEWQSKGKRNLRNKDRKLESRKYGDRCDEYVTSAEFSDICSHGLGQKVHSNGIGQSLLNSCTLLAKPKKVLDDGLQEGKRMCQKETNIGGQTELNQLPDESVMPQRMLPYGQSCSSVHSFQKSDFCPDASLFSVKIEVKANHRPRHVPLVSLMSKLNGKAIVGHPLTIEILHDGYSDQWLNGLQSDLEDEARPHLRTRSIKAKRLKSSQPRISIRKSSKTKKAAAQLSKKTRKLSSFTAQRHLKGVVIPAVEKPEGPLIACIPLKVVFSRINEALSGLMR